jgi:anti-sigma regulatory factor (Ser/Thr protein kinase)
MDSRQFEVRLPPGPASPAAARRSVEDALGSSIGQPRLDDVRILISELVSNCVRHAELGPGDAVAVTGSVGPTVLRMEVADGGPGFEPDLPHLGDPDTGWGLYILDQLADRWGTTRDEASTVWFEMDLDAAGDPAG